jgi:ABC-type nitrate/sulfonate/bicarbonate transport system substrate-binding protein
VVLIYGNGPILSQDLKILGRLKMKMKHLAQTAFIAAFGAALVTSTPAISADKIRFAKVVPHPFQFLIADLGMEKGIFQKHGIELDIFATGGSAKLHQALAVLSDECELVSVWL